MVKLFKILLKGIKEHARSFYNIIGWLFNSLWGHLGQYLSEDFLLLSLAVVMLGIVVIARVYIYFMTFVSVKIFEVDIDVQKKKKN